MNIYLPQTPNKNFIFEKIIEAMLATTDWTQLADAPLSEEDKNAWRSWRSYVRSLEANRIVPESGPVIIDDSPSIKRPKSWINFTTEIKLHN